MSERLKIGEILIRTGLIEESQLHAALGEQSRWGGRVGVTLVKMGFLSEEDLVRALGSHFGIPVVKLEGKRISEEITSLLPADFVEKHACIPLFVHRETGAEVLFVGMDDPGDLAVLDDISFRTGMQVRPVLVGPLQVRAAIEEFYAPASSGNPDDSGYDFPVQVGAPAPAPPQMPTPPPAAPPTPAASAHPDPVRGPSLPEPGYEHTFDPVTGEDQVPDLADLGAAPVPTPPVTAAPKPAPETAPQPVDPATGKRQHGFGPEVSRMGTPAGKSQPVATRDILRAVTKILISQGVFTRQELVEALRAVTAESETPQD